MFQVFNTVSRIVHGPGSADELAEEIKLLKGSRGMVISDHGIKAAGLLDRVETTLDKAKLVFSTFYDVTPDPGIDVVALSTGCRTEGSNPDFIVGIGWRQFA